MPPPQIVIDPSNHGAPVATTTINVIPPGARRFGFVPDLSYCQPGDLILSYARSRGIIDGLIVYAQDRAGFHTDDSRWTHAAVLLYQDLIVEAVPRKGVISRSLYEDIPDSVLRVRRYPHLVENQGYEIALSALRMQGRNYSTRQAFLAGLRAASGGLWNRAWYPLVGRAIICSNIFYDAFGTITRRVLRDCPFTQPVYPAHLSATADLVDVHVPWLRLS
jgi:hypothetical protein